ncbi:hypothetical protein DOY81_001788 [Sarcophaga bullata]|nr:hypothetical protein DOY81_001788 [Sarcophaga bullata]
MGETSKLSHEEQFEKVKEICQPFLLTNEQLQTIKESFLSEIQKGLKKETNKASSIKCWPTYVQEFPTGCEYGMFLVVEVGGSNFRISCIHLKGPRDYNANKETFDLSTQLENGDVSIIFDRITECLHKFLKGNDLLREPLALTLCMTYVLFNLSLNKAVVKDFPKNVYVQGLVNKDVVSLLQDAIERRKDLRVTVVAVLNDCTAALLCSNHFENVCSIGVMIGSTCNAVYVENADEVELFESNSNNGIKRIVVDTLWGEFGSNGHLDAITTEFDKKLDHVSSNEGKHKFVKMTAGYYMGELARQVFASCIEKGILFEGTTSSVLSTPFKFMSHHVSTMLSEEEDSYDHMRLIFDKLGITQPPDNECAKAHYIMRSITQRSAQLVACGIASLIEKINQTHTGVAMGGGFYFKSRIYKDLVEKKLKELLGESRTFEIKSKEGSVAVGSAILAAITTRSEFLYESEEMKTLFSC